MPYLLQAFSVCGYKCMYVNMWYVCKFKTYSLISCWCWRVDVIRLGWSLRSMPLMQFCPFIESVGRLRPCALQVGYFFTRMSGLQAQNISAMLGLWSVPRHAEYANSCQTVSKRATRSLGTITFLLVGIQFSHKLLSLIQGCWSRSMSTTYHAKRERHKWFSWMFSLAYYPWLFLNESSETSEPSLLINGSDPLQSCTNQCSVK